MQQGHHMRRLLAAELSRRDALRLTAGAAAGLGLGSLPTGFGPPRRAVAQTEQRPTLRVGVAVTTETMDPHADFRNQRGLLIYSIFDGLLRRDFLGGDPPGSGGGVVPGLASTWERVDDLSLELKLREGVVFHDGSPMTADDVKFSFDLVLTAMADVYPLANNTLGEIASVEIVDPTTIRISTAAPDPILEKRLPTYAGWIVPRRAFEEAGIEAFGQKPIGTGPYKVVEFRAEESLILEAHDAYWGGPPTAARIEFRAIPETAARITALLTGEVDLITSVPPDQVPTIEGEDAVEIRGVPISNIRYLDFNTYHPAMGDRRLRQGLSLAIDRQLIIDQLWGGRALLPRGFQYPEYGELYNSERPYPAYDPEQARTLITESGYDGRPIPLWTPSAYYTLGEEVAQAVAQMWREVGVNAETPTGPVAEFFDNMDQKAALSDSNNNEFADPDAWWIRWGTGSSVEEHTWTPDDPRFNELGEQARTTLNAETRYAAYQEMLDIWEEEAPGAVLYIPTESYGVRRGIAWQPYSYFFMDFRPENLSIT